MFKNIKGGFYMESKNNNHGGKCTGAGRPKGTTGAYKEETKKMYSFRLSKIEHEAVRNLLNEMRKKLGARLEDFNY